MSYLGGEASGSATAAILTGRVNPSGHLAETFPLALEDTPAYGNYATDEKVVLYKERFLVGYRWYDYKNLEVAYPFGHGLSYTSFAFSDLSACFDGEKGEARVKVKNTGDVDGAEVVQLYIGLPESKLFRPVRELKGFKKVFLKAGEEKEVVFTLDKRSFTFYNTAVSGWSVEKGSYELSVGDSSRDLPGSVRLEVDGIIPETRDDGDFESLFGGRLPLVPKSDKVNMNTTISEVLRTKGGQLVLGPMLQGLDLSKAPENETERMMLAMVADMPLRGIWMYSPGVRLADVQNLIDKINEIG